VGWTVIKEVEVQIPALAEIWFEVIALHVPPSQLRYVEYTDCALSMRRWGRGLASTQYLVYQC